MGTAKPDAAVGLPFGISPHVGAALASLTAITMLLWPLGGFRYIMQDTVTYRPKMLTPSISTTAQSSTGAPHQHLREARREASKRREPSKSQRRVGASIAVHPPKFAYIGRLLEQWYNCEPARQALYIVAVFSTQEDYQLFKQGMAQLHPKVPDGSWGAVFTPAPQRVTETNNGQTISAWKKWNGIAYLMDRGEEAPEYGLMMDSELLFYNKSDCGADSEWNKLYDRIRALEDGKLWPVAKVGTMAEYKFRQEGGVQTGRDYDKALISLNARWLGFETICAGLNTPGCREVHRQIEEVLFSWWTDLPYMNLAVTKRLLSSDSIEKRELSPEAAAIATKVGRWEALLQQIAFPQFEHIAYQQWCILHEGYRWDDVTPITGKAKWGSYIEDPLPGSRMRDLHPMWFPADAYMAYKNGQIPGMSSVDPPLLYCHVDHFWSEFECEPYLKSWGAFLEERQKR